MTMQRGFITMLFTLTLAGCASTGGDIGGLFPAPKFLKGDITDSVYTAKDKSFSVAVPHKQGSYEYTYLHIKELYNPGDIYVSFGPGAIDGDIYRVEVTFRPAQVTAPIDLDAIEARAIDSVSQTLTQSYKGKVEIADGGKTRVGDHPAWHWHLTQAPFQHEVYLIDLGAAMAIVSRQHSTADPIVPAGTLSLQDVAASLKLLQPAAAKPATP